VSDRMITLAAVKINEELNKLVTMGARYIDTRNDDDDV
jgi:hypothetical protein